MHNEHHNHHDTFHDKHFDHCAPDCDDQIPIMASMSRGLKGDSTRIVVHDDTDGLTPEEIQEMFKDPESAKWFDFCDETFLEGLEYDEVTKTWQSVFMSENINGGRIHFQFNLRPHTIPQTFTITIIYRRPGRTELSVTSPAIPYLWDADGDGKPDVDGVVGAGIGNLFLRESVNADWIQIERHGSKTPVPPQLPDNVGRWGQLNWPEGTEPRDFNGVAPEEAWAATATFGHGGDIPLPNLDDLAKILGWTREDLEAWLQDMLDPSTGSENVKHYIDRDLGFPDGTLPGSGGNITVKEYIDNSISNAVTNITNNLTQTFTDILNKIYGGGTFDPDTGEITWPNTDKIPTGNINVYSGSVTSDKGLFTHENPIANNDLEFQ